MKNTRKEGKERFPNGKYKKGKKKNHKLSSQSFRNSENSGVFGSEEIAFLALSLLKRIRKKVCEKSLSNFTSQFPFVSSNQQDMFCDRQAIQQVCGTQYRWGLYVPVGLLLHLKPSKNGYQNNIKVKNSKERRRRRKRSETLICNSEKKLLISFLFSSQTKLSLSLFLFFTKRFPRHHLYTSSPIHVIIFFVFVVGEQNTDIFSSVILQ